VGECLAKREQRKKRAGQKTKRNATGGDKRDNRRNTKTKPSQENLPGGVRPKKERAERFGAKRAQEIIETGKKDMLAPEGSLLEKETVNQ